MIFRFPVLRRYAQESELSLQPAARALSRAPTNDIEARAREEAERCTHTREGRGKSIGSGSAAVARRPRPFVARLGARASLFTPPLRSRLGSFAPLSLRDACSHSSVHPRNFFFKKGIRRDKKTRRQPISNFVSLFLFGTPSALFLRPRPRTPKTPPKKPCPPLPPRPPTGASRA